MSGESVSPDEQPGEAHVEIIVDEALRAHDALSTLTPNEIVEALDFLRHAEQERGQVLAAAQADGDQAAKQDARRRHVSIGATSAALFGAYHTNRTNQLHQQGVSSLKIADRVARETSQMKVLSRRSLERARQSPEN
jgi:hypothetical protein